MRRSPNSKSKLEQLKNRVYSELSPWDRVTICRHPQRPKSIDYIRNLCEGFTELHGDRLFRDDRAVICGLAKIGGVKFMVIAQEKGCDTKSRLERNFGMMHPGRISQSDALHAACRQVQPARPLSYRYAGSASRALCRRAGPGMGDRPKSLGDGPAANPHHRHPHRRRVLGRGLRHRQSAM